MKECAIQVKEDHLCVISDLHLGNPAFNKRDYFRSFLKYIGNKGASLCINGDCFDLLQYSASKLAVDFQLAIKSIKEFLSLGSSNLYYVHGNHDIHSETYLAKSGLWPAIPYLDVVSGDRRIHIEHGHLYDPRFQQCPGLYLQIAKVLGKLLKISPRFFHLFFSIEWWLHGVNTKNHGAESSLFDVPRNLATALDFFTKGFDIVILAHSHRHGLHLMEDGKIFANAGAWTSDRIHYLEIQKGSIKLREWRGKGRFTAQMAPISWY
jgi:UDP-2,3-diacylglucosamine pyrophosphatase LpxH